MKRLAFACALLVTVVGATPRVDADGGRRGGAGAPSVFPTPRDPWRSWGVRREHPKHVGHPPHVGQPRAGQHVFVDPVPVWVPEQWVWNGFAWVWWPGHWAR